MSYLTLGISSILDVSSFKLDNKITLDVCVIPLLLFKFTSTINYDIRDALRQNIQEIMNIRSGNDINFQQQDIGKYNCKGYS